MMNKETLDYQLLSTSPEKLTVPNIEIQQDSNVDKKVEELFTKYVDLDVWFTNFSLSDVVNSEQSLNINYFCFIPYLTKLKQSYLIPINQNEICSQSVRKIISKF